MTEKFGPEPEASSNEFTCRISKLSDCPDFMGRNDQAEQPDDFDMATAPAPADKSGEYKPLSPSRARELLTEILLQG
jgi:hypothetical protein